MMRRALPIAAVLGLGAVLCGYAFGLDLEVKHKNRIYLGKPELAEHPGALQARKIFAEIKPYQLLRQQRVQRNSARYWIYITKANKVFKSHLYGFHRARDYDLLFEVGAVVAKDGTVIPNATKEFIQFMKDPTSLEDGDAEEEKAPEASEGESETTESEEAD